jgi:hypothetical protein
MNAYGIALACLAAISFVQGQVTMNPLTSFGGDGWVAPLELSWLGTGATERSIAFNGVTNHLLVASRNGGISIRVLDAVTGQEINSLDTTGVSGGVFALSAIGAAADGAIYACNLVSPIGASAPFKVYRWPDENSGPTLAYSSTTITAGRMGDTMDVIGSGLSTMLVAGESNSTGTGPRNGYAILSTSDGVTFDGTLVTFAGAQPAAGDFRIGITFTDSDSVIGSQGSGGFKFTSFSGATGTFEHANVLTNTLERPMDFAVIGGLPLLATIETNGNTTTPADTFSTVRVYDLTNPSTPVLAASGRTATTYTSQGASGPFTGSVAWGQINGNTANLYALSTNNGIQAFTVSVESPPDITAVSRNDAASTLTITWTSVVGRTYRVENSTDLQSWSTVIAGLAATGPTTSYQWNVPPRLFARVIRE